MAASLKTRFVWRGPEASKRIVAGAEKGLDRCARIIITEALRLILETAKTGRIYGTHQASAPGEAPASETGDLISKFKKYRRGTKLTVSNFSDHAALLELGTQRMLPRPFMAPAIANTAKDCQRALAEEIAKSVGPSRGPSRRRRR